MKSLQQKTWDAKNISAVEASVYADRFLTFVDSIVT